MNFFFKVIVRCLQIRSVHVFSKACFSSTILRVVPFVNLSSIVIKFLRQLNYFTVVIVDVTGSKRAVQACTNIALKPLPTLTKITRLDGPQETTTNRDKTGDRDTFRGYLESLKNYI